jgi:hypothetical protein
MGRFVAAVLLENCYGPFLGILVALDLQIVVSKHSTHGKVDPTQLFPLKKRPVGVHLLREKGTRVKAARFLKESHFSLVCLLPSLVIVQKLIYIRSDHDRRVKIIDPSFAQDVTTPSPVVRAIIE